MKFENFPPINVWKTDLKKKRWKNAKKTLKERIPQKTSKKRPKPLKEKKKCKKKRDKNAKKTLQERIPQKTSKKRPKTGGEKTHKKKNAKKTRKKRILYFSQNFKQNSKISKKQHRIDWAVANPFAYIVRQLYLDHVCRSIGHSPWRRQLVELVVDSWRTDGELVVNIYTG